MKERAIRRKEVMKQDAEFQRDEQRRVSEAFQRAGNISRGGGIDPRRRQEAADAGLIAEDSGSMANLPRQAQHHEFNPAGYYSSPYIDDTRLEGAHLDKIAVGRFIMKRR